ncbi:MAG: 23S rRNA (adenine(2503)-C(2))-methyltransferase RlmN [bacterium]
MDFKKLEKILKDEPRYRLKQIGKLIFQDFIDNWEDATNLPKGLREELNKNFSLDIKSEFFISKNKRTVKAVLELADKSLIETVLMQYKERNTVCLSCQVGCALGCKFCATGKMGFKRNLEVYEIFEQLLLFARYLKKDKERINNVVFMGMGEPFLNYDNVISAIKIINDKDKFNIGARKISISTAGIIEGINRLALENMQVNLAVSLHAPNDELRKRIMPIAKKYTIYEIMKAIDDYLKKTGRKVMIEYVMIDGVNDAIENAQALSKLLCHKLCMANLITYNPTEDYKPSKKENIEQFMEILEKNKIEAVLRASFGHDVQGACGQLTKDIKCAIV